MDKSLPKQGAERASQKNRSGLRHRRKRGSTASLHGIRPKHKPHNRKSTRKNIETTSNFMFSSFARYCVHRAPLLYISQNLN
jgi:hypothetical protein